MAKFLATYAVDRRYILEIEAKNRTEVETLIMNDRRLDRDAICPAGLEDCVILDVECLEGDEDAEDN